MLPLALPLETGALNIGPLQRTVILSISHNAQCSSVKFNYKHAERPASEETRRYYVLTNHLHHKESARRHVYKRI